MPFKTCTSCRQSWADRAEFLSDPEVHALGYQANFGDLEAGIFLFSHDLEQCQTTLAIETREFTDMHQGPVFRERLTGTAKCPGYCLREKSLDPCYNHCECAYVRDVLQHVKNWPKRKLWKAKDSGG